MEDTMTAGFGSVKVDENNENQNHCTSQSLDTPTNKDTNASVSPPIDESNPTGVISAAPEPDHSAVQRQGEHPSVVQEYPPSKENKPILSEEKEHVLQPIAPDKGIAMVTEQTTRQVAPTTFAESSNGVAMPCTAAHSSKDSTEILSTKSPASVLHITDHSAKADARMLLCVSSSETLGTGTMTTTETVANVDDVQNTRHEPGVRFPKAVSADVNVTETLVEPPTIPGTQNATPEETSPATEIVSSANHPGSANRITKAKEGARMSSSEDNGNVPMDAESLPGKTPASMETDNMQIDPKEPTTCSKQAASFSAHSNVNATEGSEPLPTTTTLGTSPAPEDTATMHIAPSTTLTKAVNTESTHDAVPKEPSNRQVENMEKADSGDEKSSRKMSSTKDSQEKTEGTGEETTMEKEEEMDLSPSTLEDITEAVPTNTVAATKTENIKSTHDVILEERTSHTNPSTATNHPVSTNNILAEGEPAGSTESSGALRNANIPIVSPAEPLSGTTHPLTDNMEIDPKKPTTCSKAATFSASSTVDATESPDSLPTTTFGAPSDETANHTALSANAESTQNAVSKETSNHAAVVESIQKASPEEAKGSKTSSTEDSQDKTEANEETTSEEEEEEMDVSPSTLDDIMEAISNVETPGSTCTGGSASGLPPAPGLHVKGVGPVPLPLTEQYANLLKSVAAQAPHGRGLETVVDTAVRNTLQLDPHNVSLQNPAWAPALKTLVESTAEALGVCPSLVSAELYKLLLYEKGGFFKKHRDTEKAGGMFATLVVQLPSQFTGGSFVVSHNLETRTFRLDDSATAPYCCKCVAHYADCEHEILPVQSGYRLALVYSLCYTGSGTYQPSTSDLGHNGLASALQRLPPEESCFCLRWSISTRPRLWQDWAWGR